MSHPRVLVPLAQGCEELEAVTIIDLLRRAEIEVVTASLDDQPIIASRGVVLIADNQLDEVIRHHFDLIVLPGGLPGADHLNADPRIHRLLQKQAQQGRLCAAICAAPKVLADAGLLDGKTATSYPGVLANMKLPNTKLSKAKVHRDGEIITSRGPGTVMDFALYLIEILLDKTTRKRVEKGLLR